MQMAKDRLLSRTFRANDVCYYEVYAPTQGSNYNLNDDDGTYYFNLTIYFQTTTIYINNGTDFFSAGDE